MELLTLLHSRRADALDENIAKIARFVGARFTTSLLSGAGNVGVDSMHARGTRGRFMCSADTLVRALRSKEDGVSGLESFADRASLTLVYGFRPELGHGELLQQITQKGVTGLEPAPAGGQYQVPLETRDWTGHFAGLEFGTVDPQIDGVFVPGRPDPEMSVLVRAAGRPLVVLVWWRGCQWLLMGTMTVADLDAHVGNGNSFLEFFSRLVPVIIFLRRALDEYVWRAPQPLACFVLDDPPLRPRYGFFRYDALLRAMEQSHFSTSIAFIPWNYRRSQKQVTRLFLGNPECYSLCVHGCDHSASEFGGADFDLLRQKCQTALARMKRHQLLSGVGFDDIMVFPQGVFSTTAMRALQSAGFLAAVNTTAFALDHPAPGLQLSELLDVAVMRYHNLPLFVRRYPHSIAEAAFDLFLGKPALIVEHHGVFRNGQRALVDFIERLNAVDSRLEWTSLATICSRAFQQRRQPDGGVQVRFYTDRLELANVGETTEHYELLRSVSLGEPLNGVRIDDEPMTYVRDHEGLRLELTLAPNRSVRIRLERPREAFESLSSSRAVVANSRTMVRRVLSEFRDNYIERSLLLTRILDKVRRPFRAAGSPTKPSTAAHMKTR